MKSFKQFLSESINVAGDFNGNIYMNGSEAQETSESFFADVVWEGKLYRLEIEGKMMDRTSLAENIQGDYPGAIVQNVYPGNQKSIVKSSKRYQPERLSWSD
jgi:hypothetical protein